MRRDISTLPEADRDRILRHREHARNTYHRHKERYQEAARERYRKDPAKHVASATRYRKMNKAAVNEKRRKKAVTRRREDPMAKIVAGLRTRVSNAVTRRQNRAGSAVRDLGCSYVELRRHLESQFEPDMSWENYGRNGWHVDHRIPLALFDLTDPDQFQRAVHYTNLQPKWEKDNLKKGTRLEPPSLF